VWVILYRNMGWGELDNTNHVIMHSIWIFWCLFWRYSCMIVIAPLIFLMHVARAWVTWYLVLDLYCFIIYIGFLYWTVRCFTYCGVSPTNPKVIGGENGGFYPVFWGVCDLGVLILCSGWLGERSYLISLSSLMTPVKWEGRTKDVVQVLL
jgi:hypothetical protein